MRDIWIYMAGAVPLPIQIWLNIPLRRAPDSPVGTPPTHQMSSPVPSYARRDRIFRDVQGMQDPLGQQLRITKLMD